MRHREKERDRKKDISYIYRYTDKERKKEKEILTISDPGVHKYIGREKRDKERERQR